MSSLFHMPRVLIPPDALSADPITIRDAPTLHHLLRVLRVKSGDRVECFDGRGRRCEGDILRCARRELTLRVVRRGNEPPARLRLTLAQALIRPERFEWVVEKATELGAARIVPMTTARTVIRLSGSRAGSRTARWQRIAQAAAAQCGRATIPEITSPQSFTQVVGSLGRQTAWLFTPADAAQPVARLLSGLDRLTEASLLIGPEGDFTPEEIAWASGHGVPAVRFARTVLRSETAAVAALAVVQHAAGLL